MKITFKFCVGLVFNIASIQIANAVPRNGNGLMHDVDKIANDKPMHTFC